MGEVWVWGCSRGVGQWGCGLFLLPCCCSRVSWYGLTFPTGGTNMGGFWCTVILHLLSPIASPPPSSSDLQLQLEEVTTESQERMDAQAATIAKLNKVLQGKLQVSPPSPELGQGRAKLGWAGIWDSRIWVTSNARVPSGWGGTA